MKNLIKGTSALPVVQPDPFYMLNVEFRRFEERVRKAIDKNPEMLADVKSEVSELTSAVDACVAALDTISLNGRMAFHDKIARSGGRGYETLPEPAPVFDRRTLVRALIKPELYLNNTSEGDTGHVMTTETDGCFYRNEKGEEVFVHWSNMVVNVWDLMVMGGPVPAVKPAKVAAA